jgi:putative glutamine amidotransferase
MPHTQRPVIGLETDFVTDSRQIERCTLRWSYCQAVIDAGGLPLMLPPEPQLAQAYVAQCDGVILTGGDDPRTEAFGEPTHARARPIEARRQAFIMALLDALALQPGKPVLGVCLGMQMMALHAGGRLHQYLPEILPDALLHQQCNLHPIQLNHRQSVLFTDLETDQASPSVVSSHQQAVADSGQLRVVAQAFDGVVEAVDDPGRRFYAGVQWHPERGDDSPLSLGLWKRFVEVSRNAS